MTKVTTASIWICNSSRTNRTSRHIQEEVGHLGPHLTLIEQSCEPS